MFGKYDDYDYHVGAAIEAGFEPDNGFTHIGFMVSWLIRHGLFRTEFISAEAASDLASGRLRANDLRDFVDGKLVDEMLTPVGATFLANYYEHYLTEFVEAFPGLPDYGVSDDPANQSVVDQLIDEAFTRWRALGQPEAPTPEPEVPDDLVDLPAGPMVFEYGGPPELLEGIELPPGVEVKLVDHHRHHDPVLEQLIGAAIPIPLDLDTSTGTEWGSSQLNRQLRELGVKPRDVVVASGIANNASPSLRVIRIPGIDRARIFEAFRQDRSYSVKLDWQPCDVVGWEGLTCTQELPDLPLQRSIWFAMDGYSVDLGGQADDPRLFEFAESLGRTLAGG